MDSFELNKIIGAILGIAAASFRWVDSVLMRIVDVFLSLPSFILAMALAAALGRGVVSLTIALAIVWWPGYARLIRGMVMSIGERLHVESARALGVSRTQIVRRHILPFTYTQLLWATTFGMLVFGAVPDRWTLAGASTRNCSR